MSNIILTRPRLGGGSGGLANAFETIITDGSPSTLVASGADTLSILGGTAISTSIDGSPKSVIINVNANEISIGDLGDVSLSSPIPVGNVLEWDGTNWVPTDPTTAVNVTAGPGINVAAGMGSPPSFEISLNICTTTPAGSPSTLSIDDEIAVCDNSNTFRYTIEDVAGVITLDDLNDVILQGSPAPADGDVLVYRELTGSPSVSGWTNEPAAPSADAFTSVTDGTNTETAATNNQTLSIQGGDGVDVTVSSDVTPSQAVVTISAEGGLQLTVINGQPMFTYIDTTRGTGSPVGSPVSGKRLSVAEQAITFAENALTVNDWVRIGNSNDADNGYIADFDGTVTYATAQCENTNGNSKDIHLFINGIDKGSIGTLISVASPSGEATFINTTLNVDFVQGDKIRLQAQQGSGAGIGDTVVKLTLKWRS